MKLKYPVVKNPLSPVEHPGGVGVDCETFEVGLDQFVVSDLDSRSILWLTFLRIALCKVES